MPLAHPDTSRMPECLFREIGSFSLINLLLLMTMRSMNSPPNDRRPLQVRSARWVRYGAQRLADGGVTPNQISLASIVFAAAGAACLLAGGWLLWLAALCIQARLLCNLLDGMVAVEHGKASSLGPVFNEFPDRIADTLFLAAAGYAATRPELGWLAALMAALTAYVRVFGAACGVGHDFGGPMAKQQRMATLTVLCIVAPVSPLGSGIAILSIELILIASLSLVTCIARTLRLCAALKQRDVP